MSNKTPLFLTLLPAVMLVSAFMPTRVNARMLGTGDERLTNSAGMMRLASPSAKIDQHQEDRKDTRMGMMGSNADKEIDRRIAALNRVATRVNAMKRISAEQKATLLSQIQIATSNLNALKVKIDADTDPATLKADKQSIVTSYRVFLLLIPKVEIMAHADISLQLASQMAADNATIQAKIDAAKTGGKDVSALTALLTDRTAKITDAQAKAQSAIDSVAALTPEGYPANKPTLLAGRDTLKTVREDLKAAYQDLVKINADLK